MFFVCFTCYQQSVWSQSLVERKYSDTISVEEKLHICEENGTAITDKELLERIESMASFGKAIAEDYFEQGVENEKIATVKRLEEMELSIEQIAKGSGLSIKEVQKITLNKVAIVKYDAFKEMGGKLSFALTMLDNDNNGWILNSMHSRDGCYTYIKEIVRGESYIELSEEEAESLDQAVYQEMYDPDVQDAIKPQ